MKKKYLMMFLNADAGAGAGGGGAEGAAEGGAGGGAEGAGAGEGAAASPWSLTDKGEFADGWLDRLPKDFEADKQILGKYRSPDAMAKALVHAQKATGKISEAIFMPGKDATPEEVAAFRAKIGVPEAVDKYPTSIDGLKLDEASVKAFNEIAHKAGLTPAQAQDIIKFEASRLEAQEQTQKAEMQKAEEAHQKELSSEWGEKFDQRENQMKRMAQLVALPSDPKEWTRTNVAVALARAADLLSEDKLVGMGGAPTQQTGKALGMDIISNKSHPLHEKYLKGDQETRRYVTRLLDSK
jgi:hypothetical protein